MEQKRILVISEREHGGASVVYVMSRDQRVRDNHALLAAQQAATKRGLPLVVVFHLYSKLGVRAREHVTFMLSGLQQVARDLAARNIPFILCNDDTEVTFDSTIAALDPAAVYFDFSPFKNVRERIKAFASRVDGSVYVVDAHNIIPAWVASDKQEFAAHTFRFKVHAHLAHFLVEPAPVLHHPHTASNLPASLTFQQAMDLIDGYKERGIVVQAEPGEAAAQTRLAAFITHELDRYALDRNNMAEDHQSGLSPYFHFGQLASLRVALDLLAAVKEEPLLFHHPKLASGGEVPSKADGMNALLEEMIVRKELADNFCLYGGDPQSLDSAPEWAKKTLAEHANDPRDYVYSLDQLESAQTHDNAWNTAQTELTKTGKIHGYMRMYWAKKILEWTTSPEEALADTIYLNDAYSIDGGDPNGYVGILWSIAGLHDRPWTERPVFGKIRYMNEGGLMRKYPVKEYYRRIAEL